MKVKLESFLQEVSEKTTENNQYPVLTSSKAGLYLQSDYFNKQVASKDNTGYKIIKRGQFTYRAMSDTGEFFPNMLDCTDIGIVSPAYPVFEIAKPVVIPEFLKYYFKSYGFQQSISSFAQGSTRTSVKYGKLKTVTIDLPEIEEQRKIVEILDTAQKLIAHRETEIEKLDDLIKARFVELFVGKKYEIVKAGSIIKEMRNGVSPSTSGGHFEKVLTLSAITQGKFDDKAWKEGFFTDCPSAEKRITEDDFYICRGNGNKSLVGMGVYALENRPDLVFPDTVIAAHIDTERMVLPYLWIMWQQPEVRKQLESGARTTNGTYKINQKVISEIKIICPPINEQEVFADFIKQVNKSKVVAQKMLDEAQTLFDSLMQEYFG